MSYLKDIWFEEQEEDEKRILAEELGISEDEIELLEYEIEDLKSEDGLVYGYNIHFKPNNSNHILSKIKGLNGYNVILAPWQLNRNFDYAAHLSAIRAKKNEYANFNDNLAKVMELAELKLDDKNLEHILKKQVFISIVGLLESYLSEILINRVSTSSKYFRKFIETHPKFKEDKFTISDFYTVKESLKVKVEKVMMDTVYHNLPVVRNLYRDTFEIEFPNIENIIPLIKLRHDLVHRNGKDKEGNEILITIELVCKIMEATKDLVEKLNLRLNRTQTDGLLF